MDLSQDIKSLGCGGMYFSIHVTEEQKEYARRIVEYSIAHHHVPDIFEDDPDGKLRQFDFRYTGSLGEVVFADTYRLPRPTRSFGAADGQDFGCDFRLPYQGHCLTIDVKTMHRRSNRFFRNYVLNLAARQLEKEFSLTDFYFCISLHESGGTTIATFLGLVDKQQILDGSIGDLFVKGSRRIRHDGTSFVFQHDTYEVMFKDILAPPVDTHIESLPGFRSQILCG
ncbi:MAG: hypothetical protein NC418_04350 [Muribaculaceae bacterium]|nr:hypothetical protein [Muribaculaceae bacterium]